MRKTALQLSNRAAEYMRFALYDLAG